MAATESLRMLQKCFRKFTLSRTDVFKWYKASREDRVVIENLPHADNSQCTSVNDGNSEKVIETVL